MSCIKKKVHKYGLYVKLEKYLFYQSLLEFLKYIIFSNKIFLDKSKIKNILEWIVWRLINDVQCLFGLQIFYVIFIEGYSKIGVNH